jgi:GT2 family glycosyltransferase
MLSEDDGLTRARRENDILMAENERLLAELREVTVKYAAMNASLSWRITAPLRQLLDLVIRPQALLDGPRPLNNEIYQRWVQQCDTVTDADRAAIRQAASCFPLRPLLSLLAVVHDDPAEAVLKTVQSLRRQLYREWELCLVDDASTAPHVARTLANCADDPRVRVSRRNAHGGWAEAAHDALHLSQGTFAACLTPGDVLPENALFEIAAELQKHPETRIIYSDEDALDKHGKRHSPRFKTGWNPDLLRQRDYLGRLLFLHKELLTGLAVPPDEYQLALRATAHALPSQIRHVPSILCHRSVLHLAEIQPGPYPEPEHLPSVSIIVPTRDRAELLERCLHGLLKRTDYPNLEIIVVDNGSSDERTAQLLAKSPVRVLPFPGEFNWAAMNNLAAQAAAGEVLVFLNNDTDVIQQNWLRELAAHAVRPEVGAVGPKLLFADRTVQCAGIWLGPNAKVRHLLRLSPENDPGYLGQLSLTRNLSAVTGACLAIRRSLLLQLGGFDATFPVGYNDLDLCLRLIKNGYRVVWTPHSQLLHLESASRGSGQWRWREEEADFVRFRARWESQLEHDPFFNPNLDLIGEEKLALAFPPRVKKPWRI